LSGRLLRERLVRDIDEGEIGREHYGYIQTGFTDDTDLC
jgi:hypothetical protein